MHTFRFVHLVAVAITVGISFPAPFNAYAQEASGASKRISTQDWQDARVIHDYVFFDKDAVSFTYGSPDKHRMSLDEFLAFVKARISDRTVVDVRQPWLRLPRDETPDDFWAIDMAYYAPDGTFAFVKPLSRKPALGKWSVVRASPDQIKVGADPALICWEGDWKEIKPFYEPTLIRNGCVSAYGAITLIGGKRQGDIFGLMRGEERKPPDSYYLDSLSPGLWPDGQPLVPKKAPHD